MKPSPKATIRYESIRIMYQSCIIQILVHHITKADALQSFFLSIEERSAGAASQWLVQHACSDGAVPTVPGIPQVPGIRVITGPSGLFALRCRGICKPKG